MRPSNYASAAVMAAVVTCLSIGCNGGDSAPAVEPAETAVADSSASDIATDTTTTPDTSPADDTSAEDTQPPDTTVVADTTTADTAADTKIADTTIVDTAVVDTAVTDTAVTDTAKSDVSDAVMDIATDAASSLNCGSAPYQLFDPLAAWIVVDTPKTDVIVSANICPATNVVIPYKVNRTINVQRSVPFFFVATHTGSLQTLSAEYNVTVSLFPKLIFQAVMLPPTFPLEKVDPAWDATKKAAVHVWVNRASGAGACSSTGDVTLSVPGHPEAVVAYEGGGTATPATGAATAWISLVTTGTVSAPEYITVTYTKAGCKVDLTGADKLYLTKRAPVAINTLTYQLAGEVMNP